jgi:hypothetical protein
MAIVTDTKPIDLRCDAVFGEQVVLQPMKPVGAGTRESVVDDSRPTIIAVGIYDQTRGAAQESGAGFSHKQSTVGTTLSIRCEPVDQCDLRKGDRVTFTERDEVYEVSHVYADPGGRPDINLLRVLDDD